MMKKVIITGVGGFIGGALAQKLLQNGVKVYGVDVAKEQFALLHQYSNFIPIISDFSKYESLHELIHDEDIDTFYHFALKGSFGPSLKDYSLQLLNAKASCDAMMAAIKIGCKKFVLSGTANEYEVVNYLNTASFTPRYTCIYSTGKLAAEMICKTIAANSTIEYNCGMISMAYGEGNRSTVSLPNIIMHQIMEGIQPKLIEGNQFYDMIYISDIVDAFLAIAEKGKNMVSYYVGHRQLRYFKDVFCEVGNILDATITLNFGAYKDSPSGMDYSLIDLDLLYQDTGFECRADFRESILKTAEWVKSLSW